MVNATVVMEKNATVGRIANAAAKKGSLVLATVNATVVMEKNATVGRIVNAAAKKGSLVLATVNATVIVNKFVGADYESATSQSFGKFGSIKSYFGTN